MTTARLPKDYHGQEGYKCRLGRPGISVTIAATPAAHHDYDTVVAPHVSWCVSVGRQPLVNGVSSCSLTLHLSPACAYFRRHARQALPGYKRCRSAYLQFASADRMVPSVPSPAIPTVTTAVTMAPRPLCHSWTRLQRQHKRSCFRWGQAHSGC